YNDYYTYNYNIPQNLIKNLSIDRLNLANDIKPLEGKLLTFKTVKEGITLKPLFDIHRERYVIYWDLK
ncbi:MAG: DUF4986 domain-containing protein, partial [Bacteroidota bacterium]